MIQGAIRLLNHLVEVCRNGQYGFREAAQAAGDAHLTAVFLDLSEQREQFAAQLRYEVARLGGHPEDHGTLAGALHRRWMELRAAVSGRAELTVIVECERGEQAALRAYEEALRAELPEDIRHLVEGQQAQIRAAAEMVEALELKLRHQPCF